ncbi:MAG: helix-turn-helix domain-containing protein [Gammaproteobacteria bacterium]|nr:helix-turn-helix domain-containing protein [Gammaproteobacteria bacterium]
MKTSARECLTLAEYREQVLRLSQREVAALARCKQAWISTVERGHLPKPKNWLRLLKAYRLEGDEGEREFERMIRTARNLIAMRMPLSEDLPLWALHGTAQAGQVTPLQTPAVPGEKARQA